METTKSVVIMLTAEAAGGRILDPRDPSGGNTGGGCKNGFMGLARALGRLGTYKVTAVSTFRDRHQHIDGVDYVRIDRIHEVDVPDVMIAYYDCAPLQGNPAACRIGMHHTLGLNASFSWVDINTTPCDWATETLRRRYRPNDTWVTVPNAVEGLEGVVRKPVDGRVVYHTSPDRGLHNLFEMWPEIRRLVPHATLHVVGAVEEVMAWDRYQYLDRSYEAERARRMRAGLAAAQAAGGVKLLGRLSRPALLRELGQASCFAFPAETSGPCETWSISVHECLAIGLPVVLSPIDALASLWEGAVAFVPSPVSAFSEDFIEGVVEVLTNPAAAEDCISHGKQRAAQYSFDHSAQVLSAAIEAYFEPKAILGPLGWFHIPGGRGHTTRVCEGLSKHVFEGEYRHPEIRAPKSVIDIGAGWGAFAAWAIKEWPGLDVVQCYEPHHAAAEMLTANLTGFFEPADTKDGPTVKLTEAAITSDPKAVYACGDDWGAGRTAGQGEGEKVPLLHPKDLPPCDMLKLDAEGVEAEVLAHYPHLGEVDTLLLEWHTPDLKAECHEIIERRTKLRCVQQEDEKVRGYGVSIWVR